jgi:hypothetical protein
MAIDLVFDTYATSSSGVIIDPGSGSFTNYTEIAYSGVEGKTNTQNTTIETGSMQIVAYDKFGVPSIYMAPKMTFSVNNQVSGGVQLVTNPDNPILFLLN